MLYIIVAVLAALVAYVFVKLGDYNGDQPNWPFPKDRP